MKKTGLILLMFLTTVSLRSQSTCTGIKMVVDYTHYTVSGSNPDSTFVKYIYFNLSDTTNVSKIGFTLSNITSGTNLTQQTYSFSTIPSVQDLTIANNCVRNQQTVKISLGYFQYVEASYSVTLNLYDSSSSLISSSNFNFNH